MAFPIRGGTALITGAASGIGAALTTSLAERGADLALVDRDGPRLEAVATAARRYGLRVSEHVIDVADAASLAALPDAVLAKHGRLTILVNNAGVSLAGSFVDVALPDIEWLFAINFWAAVRLTKASMGALMREKTAHIVNVSSSVRSDRAAWAGRLCGLQIRPARLLRGAPARTLGRQRILDSRASGRRADAHRRDGPRPQKPRFGDRPGRHPKLRRIAAYRTGGGCRTDRGGDRATAEAAADQLRRQGGGPRPAPVPQRLLGARQPQDQRDAPDENPERGGVR